MSKPIIQPDFHRTPNEVAADWLARELRGRLTANEAAERDAWIAADAANAEAYREARAVYELSAAAASHPDMLAMRDAALRAEPARKGSTNWIAPGVAIAMAACALLTLVLFGPPAPSAPAPPGSIMAANSGANSAGETARAAMRDHYATRIGERLSATLDDGSVLTLNTDSEVRIHYSRAARRIELLRGQALFSVAHRADWPFLVEANGQAVRALGTEFEVRLNGRALEVVLVQGRVAVGDARQIERGDLAQAAELEAGERLVIANSVTQIAAVDADLATSWRRGRVSFSNTPLREAIAEINRYRSTPLVIRDPRVQVMALSGTYRTSDAMTFEDTLAGALAVDHVAEPDGQVELVWRRSDAR